MTLSNALLSGYTDTPTVYPPYSAKRPRPELRVPETVADALRYCRALAGLSQTQLDKRARVPFGTTQRLEAGGRCRDRIMLIRLAETLSREPDFFIDLLRP